MKLILATIICFVVTISSYGQGKVLTKNGKISFYSKAPVENIEAENNQVLSVIDMSNGKMAISILMKSFMFEKALMQEHFNENYVESDKYPKATFQGEISDFNSFSETTSKIDVKGTIKIHGISKPITVTADVKRLGEQFMLTGSFMLKLADFKIEIPSVVSKNIAKNVKVSFELNHKPYK